MNIEIICIGSLKEPYLRDAEKEYLKRLSPYSKAFVTELKEERLPRDAGSAEEERVRAAEGKALMSAAAKTEKAYVFALDMRGRQHTSEKFAEKLSGLALEGKSHLVFLIGGSLGLSEQAREKADETISLSEMTFPHQLVRVILLEQLYRAQKISRGEPYHK